MPTQVAGLFSLALSANALSHRYPQQLFLFEGHAAMQSKIRARVSPPEATAKKFRWLPLSTTEQPTTPK